MQKFVRIFLALALLSQFILPAHGQTESESSTEQSGPHTLPDDRRELPSPSSALPHVDLRNVLEFHTDPTTIGRFINFGYEHRWLDDGGEREQAKVKAVFPFGPQHLQAVSVSVPYDFFHGAGPSVSALEDVELSYAWVFQADGDFRQAMIFRLKVPTGSDPLAGGNWNIEPIYACRWNLDRNLFWINEVHYSRNLTRQTDYFEGVSTLSVNLGKDVLLSFGPKVRYELSLGECALAAQAGIGTAINDDLSASLNYEHALNPQGRRSYERNKIEFVLTKKL